MKLVVIKDGKVVDRYEFPDDKKITIGRHESCEVRVDNQGISRRHAEIVQSGASHVVKDLGSSNGTFVAGKQVKAHALNNDDVISIVGVKIKYAGAEQKVHTAEPLQLGGLADLTMNVSPKALRAAAGASSPGRASQAKGHLVLRDGGDANVLLQKSVFTIGKEDRSDLQVAGLLVPRMVALIIRDTSTFWLLDVSPKGNGLTVNDEPVRARELEHGDRVKLFNKATIQFYTGLPKVDSAGIKPSAQLTRRWKRNQPFDR